MLQMHYINKNTNNKKIIILKIMSGIIKLVSTGQITKVRFF